MQIINSCINEVIKDKFIRTSKKGQRFLITVKRSNFSNDIVKTGNKNSSKRRVLMPQTFLSPRMTLCFVLQLHTYLGKKVRDSGTSNNARL